jgi:hypothetical protein
MRHFLATDFTFKRRFSSTFSKRRFSSSTLSLSPTRKTTFCETAFCDSSILTESSLLNLSKKRLELFLVKHLVDAFRLISVFVADNDAFETSINRLLVSSGLESVELKRRLLTVAHRKK